MKIRLSDHLEFAFGRFRSDGACSAEAFRDDVLRPALREHKTVVVELDLRFGIPASWLEECFGGLVRVGQSPRTLLRKISFVSSDTLLVAEALAYIKNAKTK